MNIRSKEFTQIGGLIWGPVHNHESGSRGEMGASLALGVEKVKTEFVNRAESQKHFGLDNSLIYAL